MVDLSEEEQAVVEHAKRTLEKLLVIFPSDGTPNPGAFVMSDKGNIYHGVAFDGVSDGVPPVHAEAVALATMCTEEGLTAKVRILLIMGGSDETVNMPCGGCRQAIYALSEGDPAILCGNLSLSKLEKYRLSELLPHPWE